MQKSHLNRCRTSVTSEMLANKSLANTMPITFNSGESGAGGNICVRGYTSPILVLSN